MRYGVCLGIDELEEIKIAKDCGFDYIECGFCKLSRGTDDEFNAFKKVLAENDIKCEAANGFFPRDLPLLGGAFDITAVTEYMEKGMKRGAEVGMKIVVFGSSAARAVPEEMTYSQGFNDLGNILRELIAPTAARYGITIVMEPLRKNECNIINTIKEGTMLAALSGAENVHCLADIYHMVGVGDTNEDVRQLKGSIKHAHISNPYTKKNLKRDYPEDISEFDYKGFIDALAYAGCETCSIEAQCVDFAQEAPLAAKVLKSIG